LDTLALGRFRHVSRGSNYNEWLVEHHDSRSIETLGVELIMRDLLRPGLMAAFFALATLPSVPSHAQTIPQNSPAYQGGYRQGVKDSKDNREPNAASAGWNTGEDRLAYASGYRAGYCQREASRSGYYNGIYRSYGPPVIRNGYYGYNAPNLYCENSSGNAHRAPGDPKAPQNRVEYGGGG
jgi:hypothetical protein